MRRFLAGFVAIVLLSIGLAGSAGGHPPTPLRFSISFPSSVRSTPTDGRLLVIASTSDSSPPMDQTDIMGGAPFWGKNVTNMRPGRAMTLGSESAVYGFPLTSLRDLKPGRYYVQAFLNRYETFHRGDSSTVSMHMPCGDGQYMFASPGNLYSTPMWLTIDPHRSGTINLRLTNVIKPAQPVPTGGTCQQGNPTDTAHVKHIKILSKVLTKFWGRPIYIGANILLPAGYDSAERYPVEYHFDHFTTDAPHGFVEDGSNAFSKWWLSGAAPKFISVELREENPFYDSSYVVDSPNVGPYGTATTQELIPAIDRQFRTIAAPWARITSGGSTGGWEALASLVNYPDVYGGTFAGYPDPVNFHKYQIVDIYDDANAYEIQHGIQQVDRPDSRTPQGDIDYMNSDENHYELALGDHDRSEGAWAIWEAVYGPQGPDGYPALIWDKRTGVINPSVAQQWKAMDLTDKITSNWSTLGPKLAGKIYLYVGDTDTYYLNDAVELLQQQLDKETKPAADATFVYGHEKPHGWSPYTDQQWFEIYAAYIAKHAPAGAYRATVRPTIAANANRGVISVPTKHGVPSR